MSSKRKRRKARSNSDEQDVGAGSISARTSPGPADTRLERLLAWAVLHPAHWLGIAAYWVVFYCVTVGAPLVLVMIGVRLLAGVPGGWWLR